MVAALIPERDMRGPGCDDRCRVVRVFQAGVFGRQELLLHAPDTHERWGRLQMGGARETEVVRTGRLEFDRDRLLVRVDGRQIHLTATEAGIMVCLAHHLDRVVPYTALLQAVWGLELFGSSERHLVRATVGRLRAALGPLAGGLIQTSVGIGMRLLALPVGDEPPHIRGSRLQGRWSLAADRCADCGGTDSPHYGRGLCNRCRAQEVYRLRGSPVRV